MKIFEDVNLDSFKFSSDGREVTLVFLDMDKGDEIGTVICSDVFHFSVQNIFADDFGLACYVGEVNYEIVREEEIAERLSQIPFLFAEVLKNGKFLGSDSFHWLQVESGEIVIKVGALSGVKVIRI